MKTGLRKQLPQKRRIQRPSGEQDLTVGAAPKFGKRTVIKSITNVQSITSHSYIKYASEGNGFAMWREANNKFAIAVDNIYLRKGGLFMSSPADDLLADDYVRIDNASIHIACYTPFNVNAIEAYGMTGNVGGVFGQSQGTGRAIWGKSISSSGRSGYFEGAPLEVISPIRCSTVLYLLEHAAAADDLTTYGQFWVKNSNPNIPMFTDGDGAHFTLDKTAA